ncbi:MAG TPA: hypothetical protein VMT63_10155 [Bacteroidales bacterium]|nr:hypothetical protein [Bacteroidales bacterium]
MRKLLLSAVALLIACNLYPAGLVTNTNQSAAWVRMPARNASTGIDAVYYNPAGLTKLDDGFHISISNQFISQKKTVMNYYTGPNGTTGLNNPKFVGDVSAPFFPGVYAAYKKNKIAISIGVNPVGGGGSAEYKTGLPSFELGISDLVPALASQGATGYKLSSYLNGKSVYLGLQAGVSYKLSDAVSVAVGLRYVMAKNTYKGHLTGIQLNMAGDWLPASTVLTGVVNNLTAITAIPTSLAPIISGGAGGYTLSQLVSGSIINQATSDQISAALAYLGLTPATIAAMTTTQISGAITTATPTLQAKIATYTATASLLQDQTADVTQTGSGVSPIFSINISPSQNFDIAIKYEMRTKMNIKNDTKADFTTGFTTLGVPITMFPDKAVTPSDMPALLSIGLHMKASDKIAIYLGSDYFFDKDANYGHKINDAFVPNSQIISSNGIDLSGGLEVSLSEKLLVSAGYLWANKGVSNLYQSDLTYANATSTIGFGGTYAILKNLKLTLGGSITLYQMDTQYPDHVYAATGQVFNPKETHTKDTWLLGAGLDFNF